MKYESKKRYQARGDWKHALSICPLTGGDPLISFFSRRRRWRIWEWCYVCPPLDHLKQVLFNRCAVCGEGFKWSDQCALELSLVPGRVDGTSSPRWFRAQPGMCHQLCCESGREMLRFVGVDPDRCVQ